MPRSLHLFGSNLPAVNPTRCKAGAAPCIQLGPRNGPFQVFAAQRSFGIAQVVRLVQARCSQRYHQCTPYLIPTSKLRSGAGIVEAS